MSDESIAAFVASPRFAECLQQLAHDAPLTLPVAGAFVEQALAYLNHRVSAVKADRLLANLEPFRQASQSALQLNLTLDESEAYVDVALGTLAADGFQAGEFSGTVFQFDALEADRATFPVLREQARAYATDAMPAVDWNGARVPASHLLHALHLLAAGRAAQAVARQLRTHTVYAGFTFLARVTQTSQREHVCAWTVLDG